LLIVISTFCSIIVTGSREEGMVYGLIGGFIMGLIFFYYLRAKFRFWTAALQLTINAVVSIGEFLVIRNFTDDMEISRLSYGYVLVFISLPTLISINKQLLDNLAIIFTAKSVGINNFDCKK
jgi:hypothetical protein